MYVPRWRARVLCLVDSCVVVVDVDASCRCATDAVLDDGTNYCNLHNLIEATTLTFTEDVDTSDCTQYSTANCAKY